MNEKIKKNILYLIASSQFGGAEYFVLNLIRYLDREKYEPFIAYTSGGPMGRLYEGYARKTLSIDTASLLNPKAIFLVRKFLEAHDIDIIHSILYTSDACAILSSIAKDDVYKVNTIAGFNFGLTEEKGLKRLRRGSASLIYRFIYRFSDSIVAVSEAVKEDMASRVGIKVTRDRIGVIYCGIPDKNEAHDENKLKDLKDKYGINNAEPVIVSIGTLHYVKGRRYLIDAIPLVLQKIPGAKFIIAGDGPERRRLEERVRGLHLEDNVVFTGYIDDGAIERLLYLSDLMVLPSLTEGCPTVALEAMRASKPVVATDAGGTSELIENEKTGIIVPSRDSQKIATAVIDILSDKAKAERFGKEARARFRKRFTAAEMADKYSMIYERAY